MAGVKVEGRGEGERGREGGKDKGGVNEGKCGGERGGRLKEGRRGRMM